MNNIEKEIFNQFLVDYMSNQMMTPEGAKGFLEDAPSQMSLPGALSVLRSIPNAEIENNSTINKPQYEKTNFELNIKSKKQDLNFNLNLSFYLYYKEYPDYENLVAGNLKNYINKDIIKERKKIYNKIKKDSEINDNQDLNSYYEKLHQDTDLEFKKYLKKIINHEHVGLDIVINKITDILKQNSFNTTTKNSIDIIENESIEENEPIENYEDKSEKEFKKEFEDLELEEISDTIQNKDKGFIFNEEDFDNSKIYQETLDLLSQNNNALYKKLFTDLTINFIYKKIYIKIEPININLTRDIQEAVSEENKNYSSLIIEKLKDKIFTIIKEQNIALNIDQPLSFFDYISKEKYENIKKQAYNCNQNIPFVFYFPKITFLKINDNIKIIVSGSEIILNKSENSAQKAKKIFDDNIYNLNISLEFNKYDIEIHNYNKNQHYKYNHAKKIYCSSNGIATENIEKDNKIYINTTWNPKYYLPRNKNREISNSLVKYETWIQGKNQATPIANLNEIIEEYKKWIEKIPSNIKNEVKFKDDETKWNKEIENISLGIKLLEYSQKYSLHKLDPSIYSIYQSWCYLNESFSVIDQKYKEWRLFQLCFLLSLIPSIVLKEQKISQTLITNNILTEAQVKNIILDSNERVNLLFFNAGGGKTEAFLGVLIFSLFFERLNGVTHGLTAIIKYPLRLLLTQQTQRVLKAVCSAEIIRRKYNVGINTKDKEQDIDFDRSFSLGIWVGSSTTPNTIKQIQSSTFTIKKDGNLSLENKKGLDWENEQIINLIDESTDTSKIEQIRKELEKNSVSEFTNNDDIQSIRNKSISIGADENHDGHKKLNKCPFCNSEHVTLRIYQNSLLHFCLNRECYWNKTTQSFRPLPFYIVDEDIYTRYPSVIISTTDKLARFGYVNNQTDFPENRYPLGMFGIAPFYEKETKKILWDMPKKTTPNINPFSVDKNSIKSPIKFPSLIIQDETHLLIEGLGSFTAVFERNFIELIKELDSFFNEQLKVKKEFNYPHIIASTATMASPEKQLLPIYNKKQVLLFPSTGYKIYENFYSQPIEKSGGKSSEEYENYEISRIYNGFFLNDYNYYRSIRRYSLEYHKLIYALYDNKISLPHFEENIKNEYYLEQFKILKSKPNFKFSDYLKNNSLLNKILINYAGSKNVNDKLKSLESFLFEKDSNISMILSETNQVSITSDVEQKILQEVLNKISNQSQFPLNSSNSSDIIKSIFATQSISHGVDSDMFNAMTFHGFPEFINEYIQASARIGRTNVGLVNCFPLPNNKDALIMNNFEAFHRFIDRPILSNGVDFSTQKIITRTLLSLFACWFFNINILKNDIKNINDSKITKINEKLQNNTLCFKYFNPDFNNYLQKIFSSNQNNKLIKKLAGSSYEMLCEPYNRPSPPIIHNIADLSTAHSRKYYMMTSLRDTQETAKIIIQQKK